MQDLDWGDRDKDEALEHKQIVILFVIQLSLYDKNMDSSRTI